MSRHGGVVKQLRATSGEQMPEGFDSTKGKQTALRPRNDAGKEQHVRETLSYVLPRVGIFEMNPSPSPPGSIGHLLS